MAKTEDSNKDETKPVTGTDEQKAKTIVGNAQAQARKIIQNAQIEAKKIVQAAQNESGEEVSTNNSVGKKWVYKKDENPKIVNADEDHEGWYDSPAEAENAGSEPTPSDEPEEDSTPDDESAGGEDDNGDEPEDDSPE